jgi:hypothetical protein
VAILREVSYKGYITKTSKTKETKLRMATGVAETGRDRSFIGFIISYILSFLNEFVGFNFISNHLNVLSWII